jgi:hypothetical protein
MGLVSDALRGKTKLHYLVNLLQVLLCQSLPAVSSACISIKWWTVVAGQALALLSSLLPALWPQPAVVTACRALHGAATAGNLNVIGRLHNLI